MQDGRLASDLKGISVLVVEDDPSSLELIARILRDEAADVTAVSSARDAIRVVLGQRPDVLVSDIGMPEVDGYGMLRAIRELEEVQGRPMLPALALTAYDDTTDIVRSGIAGYQRHITKPFEHTRLVQAVVELAGRQYWQRRG